MNTIYMFTINENHSQILGRMQIWSRMRNEYCFHKQGQKVITSSTRKKELGFNRCSNKCKGQVKCQHQVNCQKRVLVQQMQNANAKWLSTYWNNKKSLPGESNSTITRYYSLQNYLNPTQKFTTSSAQIILLLFSLLLTNNISGLC